MSANSIARASRGSGRLNLQLFSAESACLLQSASVPWNVRNPDYSAAEVVDKLLSQVARKEHQMPGGRSLPRRVKEGKIGGGPEEAWSFEGDELVLVEFESSPAGSVVLVDESIACTATPCSKSYAMGSIVVVEMQKELYEPQRKRFKVTSDLASVRLTLPPNFGYLTVRSTPLGLTVVLDGKPVGVTPSGDASE